MEIAPTSIQAGYGLIGREGTADVESTAVAILEIRRRSGLLWEEQADLFEVPPRTIHQWASGKTVSATQSKAIRGVLAAIRHIDRGEQKLTRALLLTVDENMGASTFDLLKGGRWIDAIRRHEAGPLQERQNIPLSDDAWEMRRPPSPILLLGAEQERPDFPAKARVAHPYRAPKRTG